MRGRVVGDVLEHLGGDDPVEAPSGNGAQRVALHRPASRRLAISPASNMAAEGVADLRDLVGSRRRGLPPWRRDAHGLKGVAAPAATEVEESLAGPIPSRS